MHILVIIRGLARVLQARCFIILPVNCHIVKVVLFEYKCSIRQPGTMPASERAINGRDFGLRLAVVVPMSMNSGAVLNLEASEQLSILIPLAANTVH